MFVLLKSVMKNKYPCYCYYRYQNNDLLLFVRVLFVFLLRRVNTIVFIILLCLLISLRYVVIIVNKKRSKRKSKDPSCT